MTLENIHSLNQDCTSSAGSLGHPVTCFSYLALFAVCILFTVMTYWKYNSVTVLNLVVMTRTISNWLWIAYFGIAAVRGLLNSIVYGDSRIDKTPKFFKEVFIADGVLKALQIFFLVMALNYQRKYRSEGFVEGEVSQFNRQTNQRWQILRNIFCVYVKSTETIFIVQFAVTIAFLVAVETVGSKNHDLTPLYWTYMGVLWSMSVTAVILVILIVKASARDGPSMKTKFLFVGGVIFSLPTDIPTYVWIHCIKCNCGAMRYLTCYDVFLMVSIFCAIAFFAALRQEFKRLNQEVQWSAIGQVEAIITSSNNSRS